MKMDSNEFLKQPGGRQWLNITGDFVLVVACLGLATWLLASHDPLWLRLNPSPLILVPLLLGGRYGLVVGVVSGLLTAGLGVYSAVVQEFGTWRTIVQDSRYLLAALPIAGIIVGELRSGLVRTQSAAEKEMTAMKEANLRATSALHVAEESAYRMERQLSLHGLEMVSLENDLASILKADDRALYAEVLKLLYRIAGLQVAAIYLPSNGSGQMIRAATIDSGVALPEAVSLDEAIVERALVTRDLVTCREIWGDAARQEGQWMAALPWVDHSGNVRALILVQRMALLSINWRAFDRMKTVCQWVTCCRLVHAGAHALSDAEASTFQPAWDEELVNLRDHRDESFDRLRETARLCVRSRDRHHLTTVGLSFTGAGDLISLSENLLRALSNHLRPQDVCASDPDSDRLIVLLPMMTLDGAKPVADQILAALRAECTERQLDVKIECASAQLQASESAEMFLARLMGSRKE